ncbi:hypothetical protein N0V86_003176 [Didymella sp. IMI 355093]|nr:hypothetical protein N0V86_003176 [Didymella sp. IMI 355093]
MPSDERQSERDIQASSDSSHGFSKHPLAEELITWFTQQGGWLSPDVQIVYNESQGHHMRALRPTTPEVRNKGKASPWHNYIACLPGVESMTTPLWFDEEDVALLAGTSLAPALKERKADYHKQWEHAVSVLREVGVAWADEVDFISLLWAATIFTSRAFISTHILPEIETVPILFPVVDILNHSVTAKVEWDFKPHQTFTLRCLDSSNFTVNEELFNNYAPKQNDELLLGYGFCLENNPIEQFALKLAFQPELMQYATQIGLMQASSVPFGMDTSFLQTDPNKEQHFLRAKDHPFGRYSNNIPFFRGIPPYIVHFFFIQTILSLELDLQDIDVANPEERITLQVLTLLHQALTQRSSTLPLTLTLEPRNTKQHFAKTYRDGQAAIIHAVRTELSTAVSALLPSTTSLPARSALLTPSTGLAALRAEYPAAARKFDAGLTTHALSAQDPRLLWPLLLVTYASLILTNAENASGETSGLLTRLTGAHPLPRVEDGIEDAETYAFLDAHLDDFVELAGQSEEWGVSDVLDDLGETFVESEEGSAFITGATENLGVRLVMWGMSVAAADVVSVIGQEGAEMCLFVRGEGRGGCTTRSRALEHAQSTHDEVTFCSHELARPSLYNQA